MFSQAVVPAEPVNQMIDPGNDQNDCRKDKCDLYLYFQCDAYWGSFTTRFMLREIYPAA